MLLHIQTISVETTPLAAIWSNVELNVGIICSCLHTVKGAIQRFFPRFLRSVYLDESTNRYRTGRSGRSVPGGSRAFFNVMGYELAEHEKSTTTIQVYTAEMPGRNGPCRRAEAGIDKIIVDTILEQDTERRGDEAALGDSESLQRLNPTTSTRQMV